MAVELVEKYLGYVDEQFSTVSRISMITNHDFSFQGAHSVKIYKVSTGQMQDYGREVAVPEVDTYTLGVICAGAGTKPAAVALTKDNIYGEIIKGSRELDNAEAPESGRVLLVTPDTYYIMNAWKWNSGWRRSLTAWTGGFSGCITCTG